MSRIRVRSRHGIAALAAVAAMGTGAVVVAVQAQGFVSAYVGETCDGLPATIVGTPGPDYLLGTPGPDVIVGKGGYDIIIGRQGNDVICGNGGPDDLYGNDGNDIIIGGDGNDWIFGRDGDDDLRGGGGRDFIVGNQGADTIKGAGGNDDLWGDGGSDTIDGGVGADYIEGGPGSDFLTGGAGPDDIWGGFGPDTLLGEGGSDYLNGGFGFDTCDLGPGGSFETKCENQRPQAVDQSESAVEDGPAVTADYATTDPDGDPTTYDILTQPSEGSASDDGNGTSFTFDPGGDFQDLAVGETRDVSFTYEATDDNSATSEVATVTVTVTGVNDAPVAQAVAAATDADDTVTAGFDADDVDSDDDPGSLTYSIVSGPQGDHGTVDNNGDGTFTFDPGDDFANLVQGETADVTIRYQATDGNGATSNIAAITVTVSGVGILAVADAYDAGVAGNLTVGAPGVLANDIGSGLTAEPVVDGQSSNGAAVDVNTDGSFSYDLGALYTPLGQGEVSTDQFQYTATNGTLTSNTEVSVTVTGVNDDPTADTGSAAGSGTFTILLTGSDPDTDDDLEFTVDTTGTSGAVNNLTNSDGTCSPVPCSALDKNSATVDYTAPVGEPEDSFSFTVDDGNGGLATASVTINLDPGTEPPLEPPAVNNIDAKDGTVETIGAVVITLNAAAEGDESPTPIDDLTFGIVTPPPASAGTLGTVVDDDPDPLPTRSATVTFTPEGSFTGTTTFVFEACEVALPTNCDQATVTISVENASPPVPPVVSNVEAAVLEEGAALLDLQIGGDQTGTPPPPDPTDGREPASFRGAFPMTTTVDDETEFLSLLSSSTTYDFEQPTFPAASANIFDTVGAIDGIAFDGTIGFAVNPPPPSPDQFMRGVRTDPTFCCKGSGFIDFSGQLPNLPNAFGFYTGFGAVALATPYTYIEVIGGNESTIHTEWVPSVGGNGTYFGFVDDNNDILGIYLAGVENIGDTEPEPDPQTAGQFGIDDMTVGTGSEPVTAPDLVIDSITHEPDTPNTEETIRFEAVVKNVGDGTAGASTLSFKVGGESPSNPSALFSVPSLAPGETFSAVRLEKLTVAQNYQNTAVADFEEDVTESDENNNTAIDIYTVVEPDDPPPLNTYRITSLPTLGVLFDSTGTQITAVPTTLPDSMVTYVAGPSAVVGQIDQFGFEAENAGGISGALGFIEIVAVILPPDECALVGRPPGCIPS